MREGFGNEEVNELSVTMLIQTDFEYNREG